MIGCWKMVCNSYIRPQKKYEVKIVSAPLKCYVEATGNYKRIRVKEKGDFWITNKNFSSLEYNAFKLFHRSIFENMDIRFPDRLIHEDVEFYWKVFTMYNHLYCLEVPAMVYRIRENSIMTSKKGNLYCSNNIELIKNIFKFLEKNKLTAAYRDAFTREYYNFYYKVNTFETEKFSVELDTFFQKRCFNVGFSTRIIRKWIFNKKFDKSEKTLRLLGFFLIRKKL